MNRETRVIKTPNGDNIEIKTYIIGRELEAIEDIMYSGVKDPDGKFKLGFLRRQTHKLIEIMVVSINEKKEKILDTILDMRSDDYVFIVEALDKVTGGKTDNPDLKKKDLKRI